MSQITIVGTGLIGGSIGLALKQLRVRDLTVVAHDKDPSAASRAVKKGAADRRELNLYSAVADADLIILAIPALAIRESLELIGPRLKPGVVLTDTCSTKANVLQWATEFLPREASFVGGHPMAGKETPGIDAADPNLFRGTTYCILPTPHAPKEAVNAIVNLAKLLGARPYFIDPDEHDSYVAAVSHLPLLLSTTLVNCAVKSPAWREMGKLAASGFRDVTRLASGDPAMSRDICLTNARGLAHWIEVFIQELSQLRQLVQEQNTELEHLFTQALEYRERWLAERLEEQELPVELPTTAENMASLFMGANLASKLKYFDPDNRERDRKSRFRRKG